MLSNLQSGALSPSNHYSKVLGAAVIVICFLVFIGWVANVEILKHLYLEQVAMKFNAAVGLIALGLALVLMAGSQPENRLRWSIIFVCSALPLVLGALTLSEYIFGWDLRIDQLFIREQVGAFGTTHLGRMAPNTACFMVLDGLALLILNIKRRQFPSTLFAQLFALFVLLWSLMVLVGYIYNEKQMYVMGQLTGIALYADIAFMMLSLGILLVDPDYGIMADICSDELGGFMARRLLPVSFVTVVFFDWAGRIIMQSGVPAPYWLMLDPMGSVCLICIIIWLTARQLNRLAVAHSQAHEKILSEQVFRNVVESAPDALVIVDQEGKIVLVNPQAEKMFGYGRDELLGASLDTLIPVRFQLGPSAQLAKCLEEPCEQSRLELYARRKDGVEFPVEISRSPVPVGKGSLISNAVRDISERIESEQRRAELAAIVESSDDAIIGKTLDGIITSWNKGAEQMFGYTPAESLGKPGTILFPSERLEEEQGIIEKLKQGERIGNYETTRQRKDGSIIDVSLTVSPIMDNNGRITGVSKIIRDITRRKKTEEELKRVAVEVARSNAELEQFAYIASHDLQEPLRTVTSYVQLLSKRYKGKLDQDADDFINFACEGTLRMRELISDLLQYSRLGSKSKPFELVSLDSVFSEVISSLESLINSSNARVTRDPLPTVLGDKMQLDQLFQNLINNAIKFRKPDEPIKVHVSATNTNNSEWIISVKDNGIGIDMQYADRIFEIFQQLHTRSQYPGTGIGLAICRKIVQRHGGRIWVQSELGVGTTFYFSLLIKMPIKMPINEPITKNVTQEEKVE